MSFSDAARIGALAVITLTIAGCAAQQEIAGPGSPLREPRIDAALPARAINPDGRLHFESPEYSRRDRDLGLRR